jgi:alkyldihydroxyacetonephosphate synthase
VRARSSRPACGPPTCRLIDALEAAQTPAGDGERAVLVLGFESTDHDVDHDLARALELCRAHGGGARRARGRRRDGAGAWREAFLRMPYLRDMLVRLGLLADTFETAITWERLPAFHEAVVGATRAALGERCRVTCRFTHVYPDGPAPVLHRPGAGAPRRRARAVAGDEERGGRRDPRPPAAPSPTITPSGRDHRPLVRRPAPRAVRGALRAAKAAVDPGAILNPGVLLDP